MAVNISKNPVSEEIDPGFGADTEQRRVEFAAQLEQEAFDMAMDNALKLVRTYFITVMKVRGFHKHIPLVAQLSLLEIILIWRLFDMLVIAKIVSQLTRDEKKLLLKNKKVSLDALKHFFEDDDQSVSKYFRKIGIETSKVTKVRDLLGGVLVFSMRQKTFDELKGIYKEVYNKLSGSMRTTMQRHFAAYRTEPDEIISIIKKTTKQSGDIQLELFKATSARFQDEEVEVDDEMYIKTARMLNIFDKEAPYVLQAAYKRKLDTSEKEVEDKVKKFYGIK